MLTEIADKRDALIALCEKYRVVRLGLFGSAARADFNAETSDLDFLVLFEDRGEKGYFRRYLHFAEDLEDLFSRKVDLVTEHPNSSPGFRAIIDRDLVQLYERDSPKTAA
jgi:predicted nucleotidyltransferase